MQILQIKESYSLEKKALLNETDKYKNLNLQLEQDKNELITNYEKDKALWEGKFHFFEQQKDQVADRSINQSFDFFLIGQTRLSRCFEEV